MKNFFFYFSDSESCFIWSRNVVTALTFEVLELFVVLSSWSSANFVCMYYGFLSANDIFILAKAFFTCVSVDHAKETYPINWNWKISKPFNTNYFAAKWLLLILILFWKIQVYALMKFFFAISLTGFFFCIYIYFKWGKINACKADMSHWIKYFLFHKVILSLAFQVLFLSQASCSEDITVAVVKCFAVGSCAWPVLGTPKL